MAELISVIKILLCTASFVLLCVAASKMNLNRAERAKQAAVLLIALIYGILVMIFLNDIYVLITRMIGLLEDRFPVISGLFLNRYLIYIVNAFMVLGFVLVKAVALPVLKYTWGNSRQLMETVSGHFYEYDRELDKWFVKPQYGQVRFYYKGLYIAAVLVSTAVFVLSQYYPEAPFFKTAFYPVFGILITGEIVSFLSGLTRQEFVEDILGEDEESYRMANYGLLRDVLRSLFGDHVLFDATLDSGLGAPAAFETLEELCGSEIPAVSNLGKYFRAMREGGKEIDPNYVKSCIRLVQGKSVLFCDPFYRDLTEYILVPMLGQLIRCRKCLIVTGRDSSAEDVKAWMEQSILEKLNTDSLWRTEFLGGDAPDPDIGILKFRDLFDFEIQKKREGFLKKTGFVFLVEPSKLLATGQMGLSLLTGRLDDRETVVFAACDRNCDGLVDALSHTLKTTITEVAATSQSAAITSMMCWNADGAYMHHRIFSNISRYLGIGTEINSVAMKYQISNAKWISGEKFPVADIKWIAGQYYSKICRYANLPAGQESFSKAFQVDPNLWSLGVSENAFLVVEDEFQNLFEMIRLFSTRAKQQGFVNIISGNYLLRDYMLGNPNTFLSDPKAIPTVVADYAKTERNTVLKLLMRMTAEQVPEEDIAKELTLCGIRFTSPGDTFKELIQKHCSIDEINFRVHFKEALLDDGFRTRSRKYYAIEEETEIAEFVRGLKNAYYIAEDEVGEKYYIGSKLYGHVFQALIPGQFLVYAGRYYEVESITPHNGVIVRRAADHITGRKYYRQLRHIKLSGWTDDTTVGSQRILGDIELRKGCCQVAVRTDGYLEMNDYHDLNTARAVYVNGIPDRAYRNKQILKIVFPDAPDRVRYTLCLLMNEIFCTLYPDAYPYICAVTALEEGTQLPEQLKYAMYTLDCGKADGAVYIVEDSEIDLGLTASVERNLERYLQIIAEVLTWHDSKMKEKPEKEEPEEEFRPEFPPEPEQAAGKKKKGFLGGIMETIRSLFRGKKKKEEAEAQDEEPVSAFEPEAGEKTETVSEAEEKTETVSETEEKTGAEPDIDGVDEDLEAPGEEQTDYQKCCFLKYGYEEIPGFLDLMGTVSYLARYDYGHNPLQQVRDNEKTAEEYAKTYDPGKAGAHFCDFCGVELAGGEYDVLKDGRERCSFCSSTALKTGEQFKEVFKVVLRNMEIFYGIKINAAIKIRMTDANTIARHCGEEFVPSPGPDGRTLGFAQKDASGYSLYIENGSPKLSAMATIAHELTHIWQYQNWDDKAIIQTYGAHNRLEVYEGMAKWAEIQYLLYLNEVEYGKRVQIRTMLREDEYGRGFIQYLKKYSLSYHQEKKRTPFQEFPPL